MLQARLIAVAVLAVTLALSGVASAQSIFIHYFDNANTPGAPDATLRVVNPGTFTTLNNAGGFNQCAMIYVFRANQRLEECCGCGVTPNGLQTLSVNGLTANPLTPAPLTRGSVVIIPTVEADSNPSPPGSTVGCDPSAPNITQGELSVWATHIQGGAGEDDQDRSFQITETLADSKPAATSNGPAEVTALRAACASVISLGSSSGTGTCTCPPLL